MIDPRLEAHDANQLELKLSYLVEPGLKRQRYVVETFMFVPRTLGISGQSYTAAGFFEDTQTFVRLKTPTVALEALAKAGRGERWFSPVRAELDRLLSGGSRLTDELVRDLKLLGSIYRSAIRDEGRVLQQKFGPAEGDADEHDARDTELARLVAAFIEHLESAMTRLRHVGGRCDHAIVPSVVRETWNAVDEYVSLYAEEIVTTLVMACDDRFRRDANGGVDSPLGPMRERLGDMAIAAYKYRRSRGYPSYAVPGAPNEDLPRRRRILKRVMASVLYLDLRHEEGGRVQRDIIAGIAAAIAMLFAALVTIWAQVEWDRLSATFVAILVGSYIIKDRLKEWGKRFLGKRLARWLPDFVTEVRTPDSNEAIGQCRESVAVVDASRIDPQIWDLRHADHPSAIASHGRPEVVVRYVKEVVLDSEGLQKAMNGVEGLNDIIRFNFARFRQRMDDPIEVYRIVHPTNRSVVEVPCARVYHVNVVLRITRGDKKDSSSFLERVRVVLDSEGLKRVEAIGGTHGVLQGDAVMGVSLESAHAVAVGALPAPDRAFANRVRSPKRPLA